MKKCLVVGTIALMTMGPALAIAGTNQDKDPQASVSDGIQSLLKTMEMMLLTIPQYEAPFINENGDIIIRRKNSPRGPKRTPVPEGKQKAI